MAKKITLGQEISDLQSQKKKKSKKGYLPFFLFIFIFIFLFSFVSAQSSYYTLGPDAQGSISLATNQTYTIDLDDLITPSAGYSIYSSYVMVSFSHPTIGVKNVFYDIGNVPNGSTWLNASPYDDNYLRIVINGPSKTIEITGKQASVVEFSISAGIRAVSCNEQFQSCPLFATAVIPNFQIGFQVPGGSYTDYSIFIDSIEDLHSIRGNPTGRVYTLTRDLDFLNPASYENPNNIANFTTWTPIPLFFNSTLNGDGYSISNLNIGTSCNYTGFFSTFSGIVKNLQFINPRIVASGCDGIGILAGVTGSNAQISDVSVVYDDSSPYSNFGIHCTTVGYGCSFIGGLVGTMGYGSINSSYVYNKNSNTDLFIEVISNSTDVRWIGGLVGNNLGYISTSLVRSDNPTSYSIIANNSQGVGGLVGNLLDAPGVGSITNSYAGISVLGNSSVGGLIGITPPSGFIQNTYSSGLVTNVSGLLGGGLIGNSSATDVVVSSYWDTQTSGTSISGAGTGKTTSQMYTLSTFTYWDIVDARSHTNQTWAIYQGLDYPRLFYEVAIFPTLINNIPDIRMPFNSHYDLQFNDYFRNYDSIMMNFTTLNIVLNVSVNDAQGNSTSQTSFDLDLYDVIGGDLHAFFDSLTTNSGTIPIIISACNEGACIQDSIIFEVRQNWLFTLVSLFGGLFPDPDNLSLIARWGFVFFSLLIVSVVLLAIGGASRLGLVLTLVVDTAFMLFFVAIGYIGIGTLIVITLVLFFFVSSKLTRSFI